MYQYFLRWALLLHMSIYAVEGYTSCADVPTSGSYTFSFDNVRTNKIDSVKTWCIVDANSNQTPWTLVARTWPNGTGSHTLPFGWGTQFGNSDQDSSSYSLGIFQYLHSQWTTNEVFIVAGTRSLDIVGSAAPPTGTAALYGLIPSPNTLLDVYQNTFLMGWVNIQLMPGCQTTPSMLKYMGWANSTDWFMFRDIPEPDAYGLMQDSWWTNGRDCAYGGSFSNQPGTLWVRLPSYVPLFSQATSSSSVPTSNPKTSNPTTSTSPTTSVPATSLPKSSLSSKASGSSSSERLESTTPLESSDQPPVWSPGVIAGVSVGGSSFLGAIFAIPVCFILRRRRSRRDTPPSDMELNKVDPHGTYSPMALSSSVRSSINSGHDHRSIGVDQFIRVTLGRQIGEGNFGQVYMGTWDGLEVAIKSVTEAQMSVIQRESDLMRSLNHPRIIRYFGMSIIENVRYMVMEYATDGSLLNYVQDNEGKIPKNQYVEWTQDLASGMAYLVEQNIIHKDLALRNVLLRRENMKLVAKVSDFGLSSSGKEYYKAEGDNLPIRWCAPECLTKGKFSWATDVWAFGVTIWELYSNGDRPYPALNNQEVVDFVSQQRLTLEPPRNCPEDVRSVMRECWRWVPDERPAFSSILKRVEHVRWEDVKRPALPPRRTLPPV